MLRKPGNLEKPRSEHSITVEELSKASCALCIKITGLENGSNAAAIASETCVHNVSSMALGQATVHTLDDVEVDVDLQSGSELTLFSRSRLVLNNPVPARPP
jgi:hypothetical protein